MREPTLHLLRLLVLTLACASGGGCTTTAPSLGLTRSLYPGTADLDEAEIARTLDERVWLPSAPHGTVVWLELPLLPWELSERRRLELQADLVRALGRAPFGRVEVAPTKRQILPVWTETGPDLRAMRSAAAHMQAHLVLPVETGLAVSPGVASSGSLLPDLLVLPLLPLAALLGDPIATAYASAEICAIDVRTSVILSCASGVGEARGPALFSARTALVPDYRQRAMRDALQQAAEELRLGIASRLAARADGDRPSAERTRPRARGRRLPSRR